jgi:hypothetical protein
MAEPKKSVQEFAQAIKAKYPQYKDIDDYTLAKKVVAKYPQYEKKKLLANRQRNPLPLPNLLYLRLLQRLARLLRRFKRLKRLTSSRRM